MRRFYLQSLFLHGVILVILFSLENPPAGKAAPGDIIRVSLIEKEGEKTPAAKAEKPAEKPKTEKKTAKKNSAPPAEPKKTEREIPKEFPREEKSREKEAGPRQEPDSPKNHSGPPPPPRTDAAGESSKNEARETPKAAGEEKKKPGSGEGGEAFLAAAEGPGGGKEGVPAAGEGRQASIAEGDGGEAQRKPTGASLSAFDPVLLKIMRRIEEAKRYPRTARRMGIEGKTVVRFKLKPGGQVEAVEVAESSGSDILDKASLETVREAAPLPYKEGWLKVGIVFKIL